MHIVFDESYVVRIVKYVETESFLVISMKKSYNKKWRFSGKKYDFVDFFKIIFEIVLDFLGNWTHTKRAFKLRQRKKRNSTPEILRFTEQIVRIGF